MARLDCVHEDDVLTMVTTGQWPDRAPAELRAHAATCLVCADLALVAQAIDEAGSMPIAPRLPSAGTMWWRAQLRARQEATREIGRPITVAQAVLLAVAGCVAGALFGASTDWFQRVIHRAGETAGAIVSSVHLPDLTPPAIDSAALATYSAALLAVGIAAAVAMAVVVWALKEE